MAITFLTPQSRSIGTPQTQKPAPAPTLLDCYISTLTPARLAAKTRKALETQQGFNGKFYLRYAYAESLASANHPPTVDYGRGRIYTAQGTFFTFHAVTKAVADYLAWLLNRA